MDDLTISSVTPAEFVYAIRVSLSITVFEKVNFQEILDFSVLSICCVLIVNSFPTFHAQYYSMDLPERDDVN